MIKPFNVKAKTEGKTFGFFMREGTLIKQMVMICYDRYALAT